MTSLRLVLKGTRPPTHKVDAPGVFISPYDPAWDMARIDAERAELVEMALATARQEALERAAEQAGERVEDLSPEAKAAAETVVLTDDETKAAADTHPFSRYFKAETRFQLDAPDQGPRGPACARDYLLAGSEPLMMELRRIPARERARIEIDTDTISRFERYAQAGIVRVTKGTQVLWEAKQPTDRLPGDVLESILDREGSAFSNLISLGGACKRFSDPLTESEGKR